MSTHPIQPIVEDAGGVIRFKENKIVRDLLDVASKHGFSLNDIACRDYSQEDRQQLAQLIGYSLSGYSELSYVDQAAYTVACLKTEDGKETDLERERDYYRDELKALRAALQEPMARLFEKHPDDLESSR